MTEVRKCSDIPDGVFLQAVRDTPAGDPRGRDLPDEGYGATVRALLIDRAVRAGGWRPHTPYRAPAAIRPALDAAMGAPVPVKVFYAKAYKLDYRRGLLNTYGRRWHLTEECLDHGCCNGAEPSTQPPEPVTDEEVAFMRTVQARDEEQRLRMASVSPPMPPYDLGEPSRLLIPAGRPVRGL